MTYQYTLRPAMTAIAAVIALAATPSTAQSVEETPPIVDTAPTPITAPDPLAAEPLVTTAAPDPTVSETTAPAATAPRSATRATPRARPTSARSRVAASTPAARPASPSPAAVIAAAPVATVPEPIAPEAIAPVTATPVAPAAPVAVNDGVTVDEVLPIAGAAGLGLLALFGAALAMRRRRRSEEDYAENEGAYVDAEPEMMIEPEPTPTFVRTPQLEPAPVAASTAVAAATKLPSGFDISRFGPHVQAAYRGPTADNPSVSLKRRLTVGHFLDKKATEAAAATPVAAALAKPAVNPARAARPDGDFMFRRDSQTENLKRAFNN